MPTTADAPKCFAEVRGKRILDWVLEALAANGIDDICFVGGYRIATVRAAYPRFTLRHNTEWQSNNILSSLMYAEDRMAGPFICSYADILYTPRVVAKLLASEADISLAVDTDWPVPVPTSHRASAGRRGEGDDPRRADHAGCIAGSNRPGRTVSTSAWRSFPPPARLRCGSTITAPASAMPAGPFREAAVFEKAYLIHLFQEMIEAGEHLAHVDTAGEYLEIDTQQDFELAQTHWHGAP